MTAHVIPIGPASLHGHAAQRLRRMLVEGEIAPGAKLNERALCEVLQVSRTPLREAIKMLAAEGLVDLLPNRGAVAVQLGPQDVAHSFEVIAALEGLSGELAAQRISDAQLAEIQALHYEMLASYTRRDLSNYYRLNAEIHRAINRAAGNPVLERTYNQANARLQSLRFRSNQDGSKWDRAVQQHNRMIEALAARDGAALRAVLVEHLHDKRDVVLEQINAARAAPSPTRGRTVRKSRTTGH